MPNRRDDEPRRSRRRDDDDDYQDDEFEERPRRRRAPSDPESKSHLGLFLSLGGGVVVLALLAVGAFVWPGFARRGADAGGPGAGGAGGGGGGAAASELLSLAPADSIFAAGLNLAPLRNFDSKDETEQMKALLRLGSVPPPLIDLIVDVDRLFVAGTVRQEKPCFIASVRTVKPYDQETLKKLPFLGAAETEKSTTFYRVQLPGPADPNMKDLFLAMPDAKSLVMGIMPKEDFVKCMENRTGKAAVSADLLTACRGHENKCLWAAVVNQGELKSKLDEAIAKKADEKEFAILAKMKFVSVAFDMPAKNGMSLDVNVGCAKAEDADTIKKFALDGWQKALGLADAVLGKAGNQAALAKKFLDDARNSFKLDQNAAEVKGSLRISEATKNELEKLGGGKQGMLGIAAALLVPAVQKVREAAARTQGINNLKQMALAMHTAHDVSRKFPSAAICDPSGKPLLSWRVAILPYIEGQALYKQFKLNEPWDSKHNMQFVNQMPRTYENPLALNTRPGYTNYRVFVGGGAGFEWNKGLSILGDITDGTSNTIMIAEAAESVPWTKPDELIFNPKGPLPKLSNVSGRGAAIALFDASVRTLPPTVSATTLRALITRSAGDVPGTDY